MKKNILKFGIALMVWGSILPSVQAQEVAREAKLHTYVMENPYDVPEIKAPPNFSIFFFMVNPFYFTYNLLAGIGSNSSLPGSLHPQLKWSPS